MIFFSSSTGHFFLQSIFFLHSYKFGQKFSKKQRDCFYVKMYVVCNKKHASFYLFLLIKYVHVQVLLSKYYLVNLSNEEIKRLLFDLFQHYIG